MTKRLFAIVLAAILAIAMFTFPVAAANVNAALTNEGTRLKLSYTSGDSVANCNKVVINYLKGNSIAKTVTYTSKTDLAKDAHDYATTTGGEYQAQVFWYNGSVLIDSYTTTTVRVPITTTGSNMKVIYDNAGITLEFTAQKNVTTYKIEYTYKSGSTTVNGNPYQVDPTIDGSKATCSFNPGCSYSDLVSIKIYAAGANGGWATSNFASWNNTSSGTGSGSSTVGGVNVSGDLEAYIQNNYLYVTVSNVQYAYYRYAIIYSTTTTTPNYSYLNYNRSVSIPVNNMYYNSGFTVIVEGNNTQSQYGWQAVGYVTVAGYNNSYYPNYPWGGNTGWGNTGYGNVQIGSSGGYATASWNYVYGAIGYYINCTSATGATNNLSTQYNSIQLPYGVNEGGWRIQVYAQMQNGQTQFVGQAYSNATGSSTNAYGITKTEIKNLTVTPTNSISTSLSWTKYPGAAYYYIIYGTLNNTSLNENMVYLTSCSVPYGSNTAYRATVYAMDYNGNRIAEVGHVYNVPGTTADSTSSGKDYPSNFTGKSDNKKIKLSWKAAEDASSYTIYYKRATSSSWNKINQKITKTAVNISGLTNGIEYDFKVVPNKGRESGIVTIAPSSSSSKTVTARDPSSSSSSSDDGDINLDDEELTVTSVSSSSTGKIKVTWTNVGAPSYRIYVAEGSSTSYKACGTYTGTSATISTFGTGSKATSFKSGKTYKVRIVRTDYSGALKDALKACPYKTVTVK